MKKNKNINADNTSNPEIVFNFRFTLPTSDNLKQNVETINFYKEFLTQYNGEKNNDNTPTKIGHIVAGMLNKKHFQGVNALDTESLFHAFLSDVIVNEHQMNEGALFSMRKAIVEACKKNGLPIPPEEINLNLSEIFARLDLFCDTFKEFLDVFNGKKEDERAIEIYKQISKLFNDVSEGLCNAFKDKIKPESFDWLPEAVWHCLKAIKTDGICYFENTSKGFADYFTKAAVYAYNRQIKLPNFDGDFNKALFENLSVFIYLIWRVYAKENSINMRGRIFQGKGSLNGKSFAELDKKGGVSYANGSMTISDTGNEDDSDDEE